MSRVQLEQLNIDGLRELARQQNLDIRGARAVLFERLTDHFEAIGWPEQIIIPGPSDTEIRLATEGAMLSLQKDNRTGSNVYIRSDDSGVVRPGKDNTITGNTVVPNMHEIVQAVLQALGPTGVQQPARQENGNMQSSNHAVVGASSSPSPVHCRTGIR